MTRCLVVRSTGGASVRPCGVAVGYRLIHEALVTQPPKPGPEWPLLLHLADDADDVTRQTACGFDYMAERTRAPRSTIFRWLKKLTDEGLIKVAQRSKSAGCGGGRGERAVYEIQIPPKLANQVSPTVGLDSVMGSHKKGPDSERIGVSLAVGPDYPTETDISSIGVSPAVGPPTTGTSSDGAPVEGAWLRPDQDRGDEEERKKHTAPQREARRAPAA